MTKAPRWLGHAASRGSERSWTLGSVLNQYCQLEKLTHEEMATRLGCDLDALSWLSLCRKPAPERFAEDLATIAQRFKIETALLAHIVRRVEVVGALSQTIGVEAADPLLLAARDRDNKENK